MRIIITGGTGLIGTALAKHFVSQQGEVILLSRNPNRYVAPDGAKLVAWDGKTADHWGHLVDANTAIINLAGAGIADGRWTDERRKAIINSRVQAGQAVVAAVAAATEKPAVVIQPSGVGYYGTHGDEILTETSAAGSDFPAQVTQVWEPATAAVEALGVRRVVARIGVVLSNQGGAFPQMVLPFRLFAGGPIGSGQQWLSWVHIDDVVAAFDFFINNEAARGIYNLCAPNPVTNKAFGKLIGKTLHRPAFVPAPALVMKLIFGDMATLLLDGQRVIPARLQQAGFSFQFPTAETAVSDLLG